MTGREVLDGSGGKSSPNQPMAQPDPAGKVTIYAGAVRRIQGRMAPLFLALHDASATEPEARRGCRRHLATNSSELYVMLTDRYELWLADK